MALRQILRGKKGMGKQYDIPYYFKAAEKNIKFGRGEEDGNFGKENQDF